MNIKIKKKLINAEIQEDNAQNFTYKAIRLPLDKQKYKNEFAIGGMSGSPVWIANKKFNFNTLVGMLIECDKNRVITFLKIRVIIKLINQIIKLSP